MVTDVAKQVRPIVAACACAGIIMGITSLTNLGIKLSGLIVTVSQGNLMIALVMTMLVSLVMGMGLPTTAAYLLLAVLGAPRPDQAGRRSPARTPVYPVLRLYVHHHPCRVALSTYAAAGISGGSPMKTGIYAMKLASVAFLIPYIFVYGQELLLYGSLGSILLAILSASLGCVAPGQRHDRLAGRKDAHAPALCAGGRGHYADDPRRAHGRDRRGADGRLCHHSCDAEQAADTEDPVILRG